MRVKQVINLVLGGHRFEVWQHSKNWQIFIILYFAYVLITITSQKPKLAYIILGFL